METERIKLLLKAIQAGNLSCAAEQCGYTVSGISKAIATLEGELGFALLYRNRKGVSPTPACISLLPAMERILAQVEEFEKIASTVHGEYRGTIIIGTPYTLFFSTFSQLIREFVRLHPGLHFQFVNGSSTNLAKRVENGEVDLCMISRRDGNFDWISLFYDALVAWVPGDHPQVKEGSYALSQISEDPYISIFPRDDGNDLRLFKKKELKPAIKFTTSNIDSAFSMIEMGLGISIVNRLTALSHSGNAAALPLNPPQSVEIGFALSKNATASSYTRQFVNFILQDSALTAPDTAKSFSP